MKVITDEPMTIEEVFEFTGEDAIWKSANLGRVLIYNATGGIEIEVDNIAIIKGKKFGLRKSHNTKFDYVGVLIK